MDLAQRGERKMIKKLTLIHTVPGLVSLFGDLCKEIMPQVAVYHLVEESLLKNLLQIGEITAYTNRRVVETILSAEDGGADAVLVTCSSIGPCVPLARPLCRVPVLRIDDAMAEQAVQQAKRIGVAATAKTTLRPTADLIEEKARQAKKEVSVQSSLYEEAFSALMAGDTARHDSIVLEGLKAQERQGAEVLVLAQASMARLASPAAKEVRVPVLTSPRLAVERAQEALGA
ncbi:MAG: aspartate/glutamate racemase family protein [candidate division NC10 bacterium]|nr:aspartate/glutamate racemase family protein [candidate division NC10 bacterium]